MKLIVDANILISAIICTSGKTRNLLFSEKLHLYAPDLLIEEIREHKAEIMRKSRLRRTEFDAFVELAVQNIFFVDFESFEFYISQAKEVCPDEDDTEYLALALAVDCPLWTNDKRLRNQKIVKILSTKEILEMNIL